MAQLVAFLLCWLLNAMVVFFVSAGFGVTGSIWWLATLSGLTLLAVFGILAFLGLAAKSTGIR